MEETTFQPRTDFTALHEAVTAIRQQIGKVIIGQHEMIDLLITGLLTQGHVLIEGVPGVAKTLTAKLLARCIDTDFSRLQFTPDIMPADVVGTSVFNPEKREFEYKRGPIFGNLVLIDEINRAPAKTQAALFEVMEERQVTNDGITHPVPAPFMVVATQNPIEQEGTYRLPEAQLDRFLFKIEVKYPALAEELAMLQSMHRYNGMTDMTKLVQPVVTATQILEFQALVRTVHIENKLLHYIASLVHETRNNASLYLGASPRASLAMMNCAKSVAAMNNRDFVTPDDIVSMLPNVLRHRIVLTPEREMEGISADEVIAQIIKSVEVPR
jgi:MoxR-like ATPase